MLFDKKMGNLLSFASNSILNSESFEKEWNKIDKENKGPFYFENIFLFEQIIFNTFYSTNLDRIHFGI